MEINWSIAGWIGAIIVLYLVGYYEGRSVGYKRRKKEELKEKETELAPPIPSATADDPGVLRIKSENGMYTLDLDGTRVLPAALSTDQRKRLVELVNAMRPWLDGRATPAAPVATPTPSAASEPDPLERISALAQPATPPPPVMAPPPVTVRPAIIAKEDRPVIPATSMVNQIDIILQAHIEGTPLEERGVFLTESPGGGVAVFVGTTRYSGVEEVPDPEIKAAIRAAIKEWENRYTPGF